ncbi:archease [Methanocalculus chunghsingensis]|nr:archease [Methanocalculus chunghsingensis]
MVNPMSIEELPHTADVRRRIRAESREELFSLAAKAMFAVLYPGKCDVWSEKTMTIDADDPEDLLWEFLSDLLYISEVESFVVCETVIRFTGSGLIATLRGEPFQREKHEGGREIKGVSLSGLSIQTTGDMMSCDIIFDI